jgi:hypothetical protein
LTGFSPARAADRRGPARPFSRGQLVMLACAWLLSSQTPSHALSTKLPSHGGAGPEACAAGGAAWGHQCKRPPLFGGEAAGHATLALRGGREVRMGGREVTCPLAFSSRLADSASVLRDAAADPRDRMPSLRGAGQAKTRSSAKERGRRGRQGRKEAGSRARSRGEQAIASAEAGGQGGRCAKRPRHHPLHCIFPSSQGWLATPASDEK